MAEKQSLVTVTQGFLRIISGAAGGEVDLTVAERALRTTKRRLYDVVNVLAGVGLIARSGKSRVRWISGTPEAQPRGQPDLADRERELDGMIAQVDADLVDLSDSELFRRFGWIDSADAAMCTADDDVTVYSLKGPPTMRITIDPNGPDPENHTIVCSVDDPGAGAIDFVRVQVRRP
jgi:transcription factor E2F3